MSVDTPPTPTHVKEFGSIWTTWLDTLRNQVTEAHDERIVSADGIAFPATQVASSDPNTLDDYEEGSWTPIFRIGATTETLSSTYATYTKIGDEVTVFFRGVLGSKVGTGSATMQGLPFTPAHYAGAPIYTNKVLLTDGNTLADVAVSSGTISFLKSLSSTGTNNTALADTDVAAASSQFRFQLIYKV